MRDILEHAAAEVDFVSAFADHESLAADRRTFWAIIRALEVIGAAARQIPMESRAAHPEMHWRGMTGMRDKVIHDYFRADASVFLLTVRGDLPTL